MVVPSAVDGEGAVAACACASPPGGDAVRASLDSVEELGRSGVDVDQSPRSPSSATVRTVVDLDEAVAEADHRGDPHRAGEHGRVRRGASASRGDAQHHGGVQAAVSAGVRSSATRMPGASSAGAGRSTPRMRASTWAPTLRRSSARARRYGSSSVIPRGRRRSSIAPCHACAAVAAPSSIDSAGRREQRRRRAGTTGARRRSRPPARPPWTATSSRWCSIAVAVSASARSSAASSASRGRSRRRGGTLSAGAWKRRAGPIAIPGEAANPRSTPSRVVPVLGSGGASIRRRLRGRLGARRRSLRAASARSAAIDVGGAGPGGADLDLVPDGGAQRGDGVQAPGVGGAPAVGQVPDRARPRRTPRRSARTARPAGHAARAGSRWSAGP